MVRFLLGTIILISSTALVVGLFSTNQEVLPYIIPFFLLVTLYFINKYVYTPAYIACISTILFIVFGFIGVYMYDGYLNIPYVSYLHLTSIATSFLLYFSIMKHKKILVCISAAMLLSIIFINLRFRDKIASFYLYGSSSELLKKDIRIQRLSVRTKNDSDTTLVFNTDAYIVDIWGLYCPICYKDMFFLDSLMQEDTSLRLVSLLAYRKQDIIKSIKKLKELNNSYPSYIIQDSTLLRRLQIDKFPNYLILYKNKIIYRNSFEKVLKRYYELNKLQH